MERLIARFATEEANLFANHDNYPDLDDSLDSTYRGAMDRVVGEAYQVGVEWIGEE